MELHVKRCRVFLVALGIGEAFLAELLRKQKREYSTFVLNSSCVSTMCLSADASSYGSVSQIRIWRGGNLLRQELLARRLA